MQPTYRRPGATVPALVAGDPAPAAASLCAVRVRLFLGMWATLLFVVGLTIVANDRLGLSRADDQILSGPDGGTVAPGTGEATTTTAGVTVVPGPGQVRVTGTVTAVHLEDAVLDPRQIPTPLTIVSDRGFGNGGDVTGVLVDGRESTIVWDGGRPFVLSSGGPLVLDPVAVDLVPDGLRLVLGGGAHSFSPGPYRLDTPVAVGTAGIATPRDQVTFEATEASLLEARGDAGILLGPSAARHLLGPGLVELAGALELTRADGSSAAGSFNARGAFDLTFRPDGSGGWVVEGLVDEAG